MKIIIQIFLLFILIFLTGDETMFILSALSSRGFISIGLIFLISLLSNLTSDTAFFFFGKKFLDKIKYKRAKKYIKLSKKVLKNKPRVALFVSKFVYGTRIITVITLGTSIKYRKFLLFDLLSLIPITAILLLFGWFAGKGFNLFYIYKPLTIIPLVVFVIFILFKKWGSKKFVQLFLHTKKQKE